MPKGEKENHMYKMIIIDDEILMLEYLAAAIDWNEYGFELVSTFKNGEKAVEFLKDNEVDLVITDIKMPKLDGIGVAKYCYENKRNTKVIIVSAYSDFERAKTAIEYRVYRYLLKPLSYNEITNALTDIAKELDCAAGSFADNDYTTRLFRKMFSMIYLKTSNDAEIELLLKEIDGGLEYNNSPVSIINICVNNFDEYVTNVWKHGVHEFYNAVQNLVTFKKSSYYSFSFRYYYNNIEIILIGRNSQKCDEEGYIQEVCENLKSILSVDVSLEKVKSYESIQSMNSRNIETAVDEHEEMKSVIDRVMGYINTNYKERIGLDSIAEYVNMSPAYLSSYFKKITGKNITEYITNIRMINAEKMLKNPNNTVDRVCLEVGYQNRTHFYNLFKNSYGKTPAKYREEYFKSIH